MSANAQTKTVAPSEQELALFWIYSRVMRDGLANYDLKPREYWLAQVLVLETYDQVDATGAPAPVAIGRLRLEDWARRSGYDDAKGPRVDKLVGVLKALVDLGIVDVNWVEGTYEPRPAAESWSRLKALRAKPRCLPLEAQRILNLGAERPLSSALAEVSRERALDGVGAVVSGAINKEGGPNPDYLARPRQSQGRSALPFYRLKAALDNPDELLRLESETQRAIGHQPVGDSPHGPSSAENSADSSAVSAENSAETQLAENGAVTLSAENSAEKREGGRGELASLALYRRAKLAKGSAENSAEKRITPVEAREWLLKVDHAGTMRGRFCADYEALCENHPGFVLGRLRGAFEDHERRFGTGPYRLTDPVGWMGRKAADEGRMKWSSHRR